MIFWRTLLRQVSPTEIESLPLAAGPGGPRTFCKFDRWTAKRRELGFIEPVAPCCRASSARPGHSSVLTAEIFWPEHRAEHEEEKKYHVHIAGAEQNSKNHARQVLVEAGALSGHLCLIPLDAATSRYSPGRHHNKICGHSATIARSGKGDCW